MRILFDIMAKHPSGESEQIYYDIGDRRFISVTERCNLHCQYCPRTNRHDNVLENYQLPTEPSLTRLIDTVCATGNCREVVFSGLGEPTYRLYDILKASRYLQGKGVKVVLHTNGLADRIHDRLIAPDLEDNIDEVNVSLNAHETNSYDRICRPQIPNAFDSVLGFIECVKDYVPTVNIMSTAGAVGVESQEIRNLAERLGVGFKEAPLAQPC